MKTLTGKFLLAALLLAVQMSLPATNAFGQQPPAASRLPKPTGAYGVGTTVWHWSDGKRLDELTAEPGDVRELMAQAWYPAPANSPAAPAPYAALYSELAGLISWSKPSVPFGPEVKNAPVILICPGRGVARHFYTSLAEDLASHGYAVFAIDMPYLGRVVYPDGRIVRPAPEFGPSAELMAGPYEKVDEFFERPTALGAGDVAFALRRIEQLNQADPAGRFVKRLDLTRIGIFGHSLGARIAGAAVAADRRFAAYASMEGVPPRAARRGGLDAAVAILMSSAVPASAQPNFREVIPRRRNDVWLLTLQGFGHNSVTDLPLLNPKDFAYAVEPAIALDVTRTVLRAFFDSYVRGVKERKETLRNLPLISPEYFPKL